MKTVKLVLFSRYPRVPNAKILRRYELKGECYLEVRVFVPIVIRNKEMFFGWEHTITLSVSVHEFFESEVGQVIQFTLSKIICREYSDQAPVVAYV
jgi:hypothetical protein